MVAILESDDYGDEKTMAGAIVRALGRELGKRTFYALRPAGAPLAYGPYPTETAARNAWEKGGVGEAVGTVGSVFQIQPFNAEEHEDATVLCICGHRKMSHADRGRCATYHPSFTGPKHRMKPNWPQCPCPVFQH